MTVTISYVVLPQMQGSLSATQDQIAWSVTFNLVATAVGTPASGWLANRFGRRALMIWCVTGFSVASLRKGMKSPSPHQAFVTGPRLTRLTACG